MKHHHYKLKWLVKNLYLCTDSRSTTKPSPEGSTGGGGYVYLGFENKLQKVAKNQRKLERKALSILKESKEVRPTGNDSYG